MVNMARCPTGPLGLQGPRVHGVAHGVGLGGWQGGVRGAAACVAEPGRPIWVDLRGKRHCPFTWSPVDFEKNGLTR